jgi:hypothetical protein
LCLVLAFTRRCAAIVHVVLASPSSLEFNKVTIATLHCDCILAHPSPLVALS